MCKVFEFNITEEEKGVEFYNIKLFEMMLSSLHNNKLKAQWCKELANHIEGEVWREKCPKVGKCYSCSLCNPL